MTGSLNKMSNAFIGLAVGGVAFFAGLARTAPAVAGAMSRIQVSMGELGRAVGVALKPQFEFFADKLQDIADFVEAHPNLVGNITTSILLLGGALVGIKFFQFATGVNLLAIGFSALAGVLGLPVWVTVLGTLALIGVAVANIAFALRATRERGGGTGGAAVSFVEVIGGAGPFVNRFARNFSIGGIIGNLFDAFLRERDRSSQLMTYADQSYG
mgnify:CR=1 FL=1